MGVECTGTGSRQQHFRSARPDSANPQQWDFWWRTRFIVISVHSQHSHSGESQSRLGERAKLGLQSLSHAEHTKRATQAQTRFSARNSFARSLFQSEKPLRCDACSRERLINECYS